MYEFECLTTHNEASSIQECSPFSGACYPEAEGSCGPDCNPVDGYCGPDVCTPAGGDLDDSGPFDD